MVKNEVKKHSLFLEDRAKISLTGVSEVYGFSENNVQLKTTMGALSIKGRNINISKLNTDTGELFINGEITSMLYSRDKQKGKLLEGLFK